MFCILDFKRLKRLNDEKSHNIDKNNAKDSYFLDNLKINLTLKSKFFVLLILVLQTHANQKFGNHFAVELKSRDYHNYNENFVYFYEIKKFLLYFVEKILFS